MFTSPSGGWFLALTLIAGIVAIFAIPIGLITWLLYAIFT